MPLLLHIETATDTCSVALSDNGNIVGIKEAIRTRSHASILTVFINDIFKKTGLAVKDIDAVAVSKGPGSYTGLRIGVASAKGLCYATNKPLISVNTLQSMCGSFIQDNTFSEGDLFCPMIDARRMEVYCALFNTQLNFVEPTAAVILENDFLKQHLNKNKIHFFGDGAEKLKPLIANNNSAIFIDDFSPSSKGMIALAEKKYANNDFENTAYFEPFYLKDFVGVKKIN
jgi:tRNA threonylcarbamoyladenosine biosynthesis protein TsaB